MARKVFITSDMSEDEGVTAVAEQNQLAALLWPWFLTAFDDWGRASANSSRLKAKVFPMNLMVTPEIIDAALQLYAKEGLVSLYEVAGKRYMAIAPEKWFKYQTHIRSEKRATDKSRNPAPPDLSDLSNAPARNCANLRALADNCIPSPSPSPTPSPSEDYIVPIGTLECSDAPAEKPHDGGAQSYEGHTPVSTGKGEEYPAEFEEFWSVYPRQKEKKAAYSHWKARIKEKYKPADIIAAARLYAIEVRGKEEQFIKQAKTFLGSKLPFADYIKPVEGGKVYEIPRNPEQTASASKYRSGRYANVVR